MRVAIVAILLTHVVTLMAQKSTPPPLESRVKDLEDAIEVQRKVISDLLRQVYGNKHSSASFDPSALDQYQRLDTDIGPLLVRLHAVDSYLDGYRITFGIFNPLFVKFSGFSGKLEWNARAPVPVTSEWLQNEKSKQFSSTEVLYPGRWTEFIIILPNTQAKDVGILEISFSVDTIGGIQIPQ